MKLKTQTRWLAAVLCAVSGGVVLGAAPAAGIHVELEATAGGAERVAALQLESYLQRMYPEAAGKKIRLTATLATPEAYEITGSADEVLIAGGGPRGVVYGAYALLEKLGCRFYINGDVIPPPRKDRLSFAGLKLSNRPLTPTRLVCDWGAYLTGSSTWNLAEWQQWISQSQKMGYNAIMFHTYGNSPCEVYGFNGKTKPHSYLPTTIQGRDWHTPHVNDVRRMVGGSAFEAPVLGSDAALAPDQERIGAARSMMQKTFSFARERAMEVFWALDVDTAAANPQDLISTLPPEACIGSGRISDTAATAAKPTDAPKERNYLLANPEHPEGYRFYKAHIETLLRDYPQITSLAVWFRMGSTPWLNLKLEQLPSAWQEEYRKATVGTPDGKTPLAAPEMLGIVKITQAFRKALDEIGRTDVKLAVGSWNFNPRFLAGLELFLPPEVPFIGLDYKIHHHQSTLTTPGEDHDALVRYARRRPLIPIIWAQGDDNGFYGRSFTPFSKFASKLEELHASGYGVIHWATRPFDLYFASHSRQVWQQTRDEPLETTCADMAEHLLGNPALAAYLQSWATQAPMFGTAAGVPVVVEPKRFAQILGDCDQRLAMLGRGGNAEVAFYRKNELFTKGVFTAHQHYENAVTLSEKGEWEAARTALAQCRPEEAIEWFAKPAGLGGITRGEQGQLTSLSLQWLPTVLRLRQMLGLAPVRCRFGRTWRESGQTSYIDADRNLWETLGAAEIFSAPQADQEIGRFGAQSVKPISLTLQPMPGGDWCPGTYQHPLMKDGLLSPGTYRLRLLLLDPSSTAIGQRVMKISVTPQASESVTTVDLYKEAGGANRLWELVVPGVTLSKPGKVVVTLTPVTGKAVISGLVLERTGS